MMRPLVIYDFATIPSEFPHIWGEFDFLYYQCNTFYFFFTPFSSHWGVLGMFHYFTADCHSVCALVGSKWPTVSRRSYWTAVRDVKVLKKLFYDHLKGLSYEIDFENVDENWQILALTRAAAGFWIFQRHLWFLVEIKHLFSGKC